MSKRRTPSDAPSALDEVRGEGPVPGANRRDFLKKTSAAAAALGAVPYFTSTQKAFANVSANDRLRVAQVGLGGTGELIDEAYFTNGRPIPPDFHGGDENFRSVDYMAIPTAVFCQPELATVGFTEEEAWHRCQDVRVYKSVFTPLKLSLSERKEHTIVKLVVDASNDRVVGCHMAGHGAAEIIQGLAVAMKAGATKAQFDATIGIHPTSAEEFVTMREPVQ